ncbi:MAG: NADH-quinone oxidoreductase subunit G, partial [Lysobacteraceae bacterium]
AMPVAELEQADAIVIVGCNLRHEVPLLHQRLRKATRRGAKVHVVNPVDFDFAFPIASKQIVAPSRLASALSQVDLGDAGNIAVIVGGVAENGVHAAAIRRAASDFAAARNGKLCRIPQGANALGLARHGVLPVSRDAQSMLREARAAYVVYGIEPGLDFADQHAALKALGGAQVVAFSQFACASTRRVADVILPIGALPEIEATLTNLEGVEQRTFAAGKLRGQARPGWRVLRALAAELAVPGFEFTEIDGLRAGIAPKAVKAAAGKPVEQGGNGLEVAASQAIYRVDGVTRRSEALQAHPLNAGPRVVLNPGDASAAGLAENAMAKLATGTGSATLQVVVDARVAPGCAWIESGHGATAPLAASARVEVARA